MKLYISIALFCLLIITAQFIASRDDRTHAVFCDVGQGDASLIRMGNFDVLIDAGPHARVLDCLGRYMPFYDRTIEMVFISHPQKDHMEGLLSVLDTYTVHSVYLSEADANDSLTSSIKQKLSQKHVPIYRLYAGLTVHIPGSYIEILWPTQSFIKDHATSHYVAGQGTIMSVDLNDTSLIFRFVQGAHSILYTGDASPEILNAFTVQDHVRSEVLKVPHHGSKNGLTRSFLLLANPTVSVISVGKHNSYKHPSREILDLFRALNKNLVRTDIVGSYEIIFPPDTYK